MFVRAKRVRRFLQGCKAMRSRYRAMVERIERGWRRRDKARQAAIDAERDAMRQVMRKYMTVEPRSLGGNAFGVTLTFDERVMLHFQPGEEDRIIEYWAERTVHMLEHELKQLNFANFAELRRVAERGLDEQRYRTFDAIENSLDSPESAG